MIKTVPSTDRKHRTRSRTKRPMEAPPAQVCEPAPQPVKPIGRPSVSRTVLSSARKNRIKSRTKPRMERLPVPATALPLVPVPAREPAPDRVPMGMATRVETATGVNQPFRPSIEGVSSTSRKAPLPFFIRQHIFRKWQDLS